MFRVCTKDLHEAWSSTAGTAICEPACRQRSTTDFADPGNWGFAQMFENIFCEGWQNDFAFGIFLRATLFKVWLEKDGN